MTYAHPYRMIFKNTRVENNRSLPEFDALVFYYPFTEGQSGNPGSMNNVIFDLYSQYSFSDELITNSGFAAPYSSGVADGWSADVGTVASEDTSGDRPGQRLSNCNGVAQGIRRASGDTVANDGIFIVTFTYKKNSGTGNIQLRLTNMGGMSTDTYDIAPETGPVTVSFYVSSASTSTVAIITSDDPTLDFTVYDFTLKEVLGGNPMIMDFNVYVDAQRTRNSYDLNGVSQFFYIPDSRQTGLEVSSSPFTFAAVIKPDAGNSTIFSKRRDGGNFEYDFKIIVSRAIRLQLTDDGSTAEGIASSAVLSTGVAVCIAAGVDLSLGAGRIAFNGVNQAIVAAPGPFTHTSVFSGIARAAIGCTFNSGNAPTNFFNGVMSGCCLWKGALLSESQMAQAFNFLRIGNGI